MDPSVNPTYLSIEVPIQCPAGPTRRYLPLCGIAFGAGLVAFSVASTLRHTNFQTVIRPGQLPTAVGAALVAPTPRPLRPRTTILGSASSVSAGPAQMERREAGAAADDRDSTAVWSAPLLCGAVAAALGALAHAVLRRQLQPPLPLQWALCSVDEENDPTYVLVTNLPEKATQGQVAQHFAVAGEVVAANLETLREGGVLVRRAVVQFTNWEGAARAIQVMKNHPMGGNVLVVEPDLRPASFHLKVTWGRDPKDSSADGSEEDRTRSKEAQGLVDKYTALRAARRYSESDQLREVITGKGIVINPKTRTWAFRASPAQAAPAEYLSVVVLNLPPSATQATMSAHFAPAGRVVFATIFKDKATGAPLNRGLVRFAAPADAKRAVETLNGKPMDGSKLAVNPDRFSAPPKAPPPPAAWKRDPSDSSAQAQGADPSFAAEVEALLNQRDAGKATKDFAKADAAQRELIERGVVFNVKERTWRIGNATVPEEESKVLQLLNIPPTVSRADVRRHFSAAGKVESVSVPEDPATGLARGQGYVTFATPEEARKALAWLPTAPLNAHTLIAKVSTRRPPAPKPRAAKA